MRTASPIPPRIAAAGQSSPSGSSSPTRSTIASSAPTRIVVAVAVCSASARDGRRSGEAGRAIAAAT